MVTVKRDNVYLYSRYRGRFDVYQGDVRPCNFHRGNGRFTHMRHRREVHLQCSIDPGVIHNSVLWLPERDDKRAREIFIEHEENAIQELRDKIEYHEWNIKMLKEDAE